MGVGVGGVGSKSSLCSILQVFPSPLICNEIWMKGAYSLSLSLVWLASVRVMRALIDIEDDCSCCYYTTIVYL